jgi:RND family efflux transporter MFP subunit
MISYETLRVEAAGEVEKARVDVEAAKVAFDRAEKLLRAKGGSQRDVDDSRARLLAAKAHLEAAVSEQTLLERIGRDTAAGSPTTIAIASPLDGVLVGLHARSGQVVEEGAPLFRVASFERLWVRVPVYAGELARFDERQAVRVGALGDPPGAEPLGSARPVSAPPSANPLASTVDLFYELEGPLDALRPGQRVSVTIPLRSESESLVVPWSAVVHDVQGGTWVYEQTGPHRFARRRIEVLHVDRELAVLAAGPPPGARVVTAGVAELFGTEFGVGK